MPKMIVENLVPGFNLMQATQDAPDWPAGDYGLLQGTDLVLTFRGPVPRDPLIGKSDDEIDHAPWAVWQQYMVYVEWITAHRRDFRCDLFDGHMLLLACIRVGYDHLTSGDIVTWLVDLIAAMIKASETKI